MQTLEAILSFLMLVSITNMLLYGHSVHTLNDSVYKYQLAGDFWRVLYLRGDFTNLTLTSTSTIRDDLAKDLKQIHNLTGVCTYFSGIRATSCATKNTEKTLTINRYVIINEKQKKVTLTLAN